MISSSSLSLSYHYLILTLIILVTIVVARLIFPCVHLLIFLHTFVNIKKKYQQAYFFLCVRGVYDSKTDFLQAIAETQKAAFIDELPEDNKNIDSDEL